MRRHATVAALAAAALGALVTAVPAEAHGLVGKQDLPIPKWLFGWAATVVLVVSFVALAVLWRRPVLEHVRERRVLRVPRVLEPICGALGVLAFAGLVYAGYAGVQGPNDNILPTVVFVLFWVGIPFTSALFGDVFRLFNPWRAVGRAVGAVSARLGGDKLPEPLPYPPRLGYWPAAVGILLFAALELAYGRRDEPDVLATLALVYAAVQLVGMSIYGTRAWCERGDAFGVYFGLFATVAPLRWERGELYVRPPFVGAARVTPAAGIVGLLVALIGTTSFDGFTASDLWNSFLPGLSDRILDLGFTAQRATELSFLLGMLGVAAIVGLLYLAGCRGMRWMLADNAPPTRTLARTFAPTLIPIALAYVVAHYFGLLSYQGQAIAFLISDPLGTGHDYLGTASATIDYGWISATGIWYIQVAALVTGHAAGLALAHDRALVLFDDPRRAARSQYAMLAVMVAFTSLALWLLSGAD